MADFEISCGTLRVNRDLHEEFEEEFKSSCIELPDSGADDLLLDMAAVSYMRSYHLAIVMQLHMDAAERGKRLTVRVSPELQELFDTAGLSEALTIEVAG